MVALRAMLRRLVLPMAAFAAAAMAGACDRAPSAPSPNPEPVDPAVAVFTLSGSITDDSHAPLAGARVSIAEGAADEPPAAVSDDAGHYEIAALPSGTYVVRAEADGFSPATNHVVIEGDTRIDFTLRRPDTGGEDGPDDPGDDPDPVLYTLSGTTLDERTREPLSGVRIEIASGPNSGRATTAEGGQWTMADLVPGPLALIASIDGYTEARVELSLDSDTRIELRLTPAAPGPSGPALAGVVVDALSQAPLPGVVVRVAGGGNGTSGPDGHFVVPTGGESSRYRTVLSAPDVVERSTIVAAGSEAEIGLIPARFDLRSFDEMFRGRGALHRWVEAPRLVIERRVLRFSNTTDSHYEAGEALMTEEESAGLAADLAWALPQLTGGRFAAFASVDVVASEPGTSVPIGQNGVIFVARFEGLTDALGAWGYGRWAWNATGEVRRGAVMLDATFDSEPSVHRRSLRAHELGHALGCDHVSAPTSVMHVSARIEPTSFDLDAARIAFQRPPLNRAPDIDPDPLVVSRAPDGLVWAGDR